MLKVAMFSGGKDSAATIALMRDLGMLPDLVVFAEVMFDSKRGISGEIPEHIDWVYGTAKPLIESWGCKFEVVRGKEERCSSCWKVCDKARFESSSGAKVFKKFARAIHSISRNRSQRDR